MQASISVIIPCLNEEKEIENTLKSIEQQSLKPCEVLIIDGGSTDKTIEIIKNFTTEHFKLKLIEVGKSLPGRSRNIGIKESQEKYIAFLDVGLIVKKEWLQTLYNHLEQSNQAGAWASCKFDAFKSFAILNCAYGYGIKRVAANVLPGSMFNREMISNLPPFQGNVRAGEDILWRNSFKQSFSDSLNSFELIEYNSFPTSAWVCLKKSFIYAKSIAEHGIGDQKNIFTILLFAALTLSLVEPQLFLGLLAFYFLGRGIIDPIRRSPIKAWWGSKIYLVLLGPTYVLLSDYAKAFGLVRGYIKRFISL